MNESRSASIAYEAAGDGEEGGTIVVRINGVAVGTIRKHPAGDSFVYAEATSDDEWSLEESNIAALKEKLEARLLS